MQSVRIFPKLTPHGIAAVHCARPAVNASVERARWRLAESTICHSVVSVLSVVCLSIGGRSTACRVSSGG